MFSSIATAQINKFGGRWIKKFDANQVKVDASGRVQLTNVELKLDEIAAMKAPITPLLAFVQTIDVDIPIRRLSSRPVSVHVSDVHVLLATSEPPDTADEVRAAHKAIIMVAHRLAAMFGASLEELRSGGGPSSAAASGGGGGGFRVPPIVSKLGIDTSLMRIVENVSVHVHNLHVRVEDDLGGRRASRRKCRFALGATVRDIIVAPAVKSVKAKKKTMWSKMTAKKPKEAKPANEARPSSRIPPSPAKPQTWEKEISLSGITVYFSDDKMVSAMIAPSANGGIARAVEYMRDTIRIPPTMTPPVIAPFTVMVSVKGIITAASHPLPAALAVGVAIPQLHINLSTEHLNYALYLLTHIERSREVCAHTVFKPSARPTANPAAARLWWKYAVITVLAQRRQRRLYRSNTWESAAYYTKKSLQYCAVRRQLLPYLRRTKFRDASTGHKYEHLYESVDGVDETHFSVEEELDRTHLAASEDRLRGATHWHHGGAFGLPSLVRGLAGANGSAAASAAASSPSPSKRKGGMFSRKRQRAAPADALTVAIPAEQRRTLFVMMQTLEYLLPFNVAVSLRVLADQQQEARDRGWHNADAAADEAGKKAAPAGGGAVGRGRLMLTIVAADGVMCEGAVPTVAVSAWAGKARAAKSKMKTTESLDASAQSETRFVCLETFEYRLGNKKDKPTGTVPIKSTLYFRVAEVAQLTGVETTLGLATVPLADLVASKQSSGKADKGHEFQLKVRDERKVVSGFPDDDADRLGTLTLYAHFEPAGDGEDAASRLPPAMKDTVSDAMARHYERLRDTYPEVERAAGDKALRVKQGRASKKRAGRRLSLELSLDLRLRRLLVRVIVQAHPSLVVATAGLGADITNEAGGASAQTHLKILSVEVPTVDVRAAFSTGKGVGDAAVALPRPLRVYTHSRTFKPDDTDADLLPPTLGLPPAPLLRAQSQNPAAAAETPKKEAEQPQAPPKKEAEQPQAPPPPKAKDDPEPPKSTDPPEEVPTPAAAAASGGDDGASDSDDADDDVPPRQGLGAYPSAQSFAVFAADEEATPPPPPPPAAARSAARDAAQDSKFDEFLTLGSLELAAAYVRSDAVPFDVRVRLGKLNATACVQRLIRLAHITAEVVDVSKAVALPSHVLVKDVVSNVFVMLEAVAHFIAKQFFALHLDMEPVDAVLYTDDALHFDARQQPLARVAVTPPAVEVSHSRRGLRVDVENVLELVLPKPIWITLLVSLLSVRQLKPWINSLKRASHSMHAIGAEAAAAAAAEETPAAAATTPPAGADETTSKRRDAGGAVYRVVCAEGVPVLPQPRLVEDGEERLRTVRHLDHHQLFVATKFVTSTSAYGGVTKFAEIALDDAFLPEIPAEDRALSPGPLTPTAGLRRGYSEMQPPPVQPDGAATTTPSKARPRSAAAAAAAATSATAAPAAGFVVVAEASLERVLDDVEQGRFRYVVVAKDGLAVRAAATAEAAALRGVSKLECGRGFLVDQIVLRAKDRIVQSRPVRFLRLCGTGGFVPDRDAAAGALLAEADDDFDGATVAPSAAAAASRAAARPSSRFAQGQESTHLEAVAITVSVFLSSDERLGTTLHCDQRLPLSWLLSEVIRQHDEQHHIVGLRRGGRDLDLSQDIGEVLDSGARVVAVVAGRNFAAGGGGGGGGTTDDASVG